MKKYLLVGSLIAVIFSATAFYVSAKRGLRWSGTARLNVLIVSLCSFREDLLSFYGAPDDGAMPSLESFFARSDFRFRNTVNGLSWTAIFGYTNVLISPSFFAANGYNLFGKPMSRQFVRIPARRLPEAGEVINVNDFEKDIQPTLKNLKEIILDRANHPFFIIAHSKYMHYPLIDRFNKDSEWDHFLSPEQRRQVDDYLRDPAKYYRKLPFLLLLANNPRHAMQHPKVKALQKTYTDVSARELTGLISNRELLREWQATPGFADDLDIIKKIYRANARYLDKALAPMLDLYGDENLKKNTIMMFAGDHGEVHMERGELTHGLSLWDESIKVPFAVRFPGRHKVTPTDVNEQTNYNSLAKVIRQIVIGENTPEDFHANLERYKDDILLGRDCANTLRGLRYANKYKYFVTLANGERFLFDLEKDPKELNNLAPGDPAKADEFERMYWKNFDRFSDNDAYNCVIKSGDSQDQSDASH